MKYVDEIRVSYEANEKNQEYGLSQIIQVYQRELEQKWVLFVN